MKDPIVPLPSDISSEKLVIAGVLQHGKDAYVDISDIISESTFVLDTTKTIYRLTANILENSESISLAELIASIHRNKLENLVYKTEEQKQLVASLFDIPVNLESVREYAKVIARCELGRDAIKSHGKAVNDLRGIKGTESADHIISLSESPIFELIDIVNRGSEGNPRKLGQEAIEYLDYLENNPSDNVGLPSPYPIYNAAIGGGLRKGAVELIAARTGIGKSSFAINVGLHLANLGVSVIYLDTEMDAKQQIPRIIANLSEVPINILERGQFKQYRDRINKAKNKFSELPFYYKEIGGKPFEEIISIIRRWIMKDVGYNESGQTNDCIIIYDYFKLMDPTVLKDMSEFMAMGYQISTLADFAKQYTCSCLALVQGNRDAISKEDLSVLSQSDRLAWLCSSCSLLKPKTVEERAEDGDKGNLKLLPMKTRFGSGLSDGDYINFEFRGDICKLTELGTKFDAEKKKQNSDSGFQIGD